LRKCPCFYELLLNSIEAEIPASAAGGKTRGQPRGYIGRVLSGSGDAAGDEETNIYSPGKEVQPMI
jgi:hypothetical protein